MEDQEALQLLKSIPLFSDLNTDELGQVLKIAIPVTFSPGEALCQQGQPGDCMYVVATGQAQVTVGDMMANPVPVGMINEGEGVGEMSLVDDQPRSANVVAVIDVTGYQIMRTDFNQMREALSPAAFKILRRIALTICDRLREVTATVQGRKAPERKASTGKLPDATEEKGGFWKNVTGMFGG